MSVHARFRGFSTSTTLEHERACSFSRVEAVFHLHHFHHPRTRARMLVFEGRSCFPPPPPSTTLEHERACSFSRVEAVFHLHHFHHPRTRARKLVFEGGSCFPPTPPSTSSNTS